MDKMYVGNGCQNIVEKNMSLSRQAAEAHRICFEGRGGVGGGKGLGSAEAS